MTARSDGAMNGPTTSPPGLVRLPVSPVEPLASGADMPLIAGTGTTDLVAPVEPLASGADAPLIAGTTDFVAPTTDAVAPPIIDTHTDTQPSVIECVVCGAVMEETTADDIFQHPLDKPCVAILTDSQGESIDRQFFVADDGNIYAAQQPDEEVPVSVEDVVDPKATPPADAGDVPTEEALAELSEPELPDVFAGQTAGNQNPKRRRIKKPANVVLPNNAAETADGDILIPLNADPNIPTMEAGLLSAFAKHALPRLGGASGDLGWSSFSTYQRCPYLFKRQYIDGEKYEGTPAKALEIGSCFHTFAAVFYQKMIEPNYPLTPAILHAYLIEYGVKMDALMEAWRVWQGYAIEYEVDCLVPLAVEYHVVDPRTKESARYDLIAKVEVARPGVVAGTYIVEHKTAGRFDQATTDGWANDGEVLGQIMLWNRLKLNKKFGKLAGVMVNIAGKQKIQKFHRTIVVPQRWQTNQHSKDLKVWQGYRMLAMATNVFPRARANCIGRYGMCKQWGHCADREK